MSAPLAGILSTVAACLACVATTPVHAQSTPAWRLHAAIEGDEKPFLCKDRESVGLIVAVEGRAMQARDQNDGDKSKRLVEIASRLQSELCSRPAADDIVILRCKLDQQDFPGARLTTVKASALIRADALKGEQPFFAWTFARIEEGTGDPDSQKASSRWCGEEGSDEPLSPVADLVLRVQNRFYELGLNIPQINGQMTPETVQALTDIQKSAGLPATGQLTMRTLQKIEDTPVPSPWVSIAFDGFGNYGSVRGQTRRGAESDAIAALKQRSHADYKVSSIASPRCIAIATTRYQERTGRRRTMTYTQAFTGSGDSAGAASQTVMQYCDQQKGGGTCEVRDAWCADAEQGNGKRYDTKDIPVNAPPPRFDPKNIPVNARPPR